MGIIGSFTKKWWITSLENTEKKVVEYADDLPIDHPAYLKKGTSEEIDVFIPELKTKQYVGVYINLLSIKIIKMLDGHYMNIEFAIYNSKDDRDIDAMSFIEKHNIQMVPIYNMQEKSHLELAYDIIKQEIEFEEIIDN